MMWFRSFLFGLMLNCGLIGGEMQLIPWRPLLHRISSDERAVEFRFFGDFKDDYTLEVSCNDGKSVVKQPLAKEINRIVLAKDANGGIMSVSIKDTNGKVLFTENFGYSVIAAPVIDTTGHRKLNNLVTEILNVELKKDANLQEIVFYAPKDGWIFMAVKSDETKDLSIDLDDEQAVIDSKTPRGEMFRQVGAGRHALKVSGAVKGGNVIVRSVVDVFNYCPGSNSFVQENGNYDWGFQRKYGLPAINIENGGLIPDNESAKRHKTGFLWFANAGTVDLKDNNDLVERLNKNVGFIKDCYDGVTCDEQFFSQPDVIARYTAGLKAFKNPKNKLIYTWIVGKPHTPQIDHDFFATSLNVSNSRGKLIYEAYCHTQPTLEKAKKYLDDRLLDTLSKFKKYYPDVEKSSGIIFGNFNQIPILSLQHHPEVDYKYYLDMQLNYVANNPAFENIGCTGYWGSYYADRELHRWSFMLLRHYCIEGKTTMLSDEYGLSYLPGHSKNGDFEDGLNGWTAKGNVTTGSKQGFASRNQNRWGGGDNAGDTFAILSNKNGEVSSVSQKIVNLTPGKSYCLEFCAFDADDTQNDIINPRRFGIEARLSSDDVRIEYTPSWLHIDKRIQGRYEHNNGVARTNLHHIIFVPNKKEITITLDNAMSKPGENLGVNFFRVIPYLPED